MRKLRIRFKLNQELQLLTIFTKKWWWSWNGSTLYVIRQDGHKLSYPAWIVSGAEEVD
jgi:hypothetical protein